MCVPSRMNPSNIQRFTANSIEAVSATIYFPNVTDSSEVSATSGEPETVGGSYSTRSSSAKLRGKGLRPLYVHVSAGVTYR